MTRDARHDDTGSASEGAAAERRSYLKGFAVALVLTLVPFGLVAGGFGGRVTVSVTLAVTALLQIAAHFRWFLHIRLRGQSKGRPATDPVHRLDPDPDGRRDDLHPLQSGLAHEVTYPDRQQYCHCLARPHGCSLPG